MNKPIILCMEPLSRAMKSFLVGQLSDDCELHFFDSPTEGDKYLEEAQAIIVFTKGLGREMILRASHCKIVQKLGAGYDKIDRAQLNEQGIILAVAKGINGRSVAEHALLLMMSTYKRLITAHNSLLAGKWYKTELRDFSYEVSRKTVGLIGMGSIGRELCKLLRGFDVHIRYFDIFRATPEEERELGVSFYPIDEVVAEADIISLHVALTDRTRGLVNKDFLGKMKPNAILINTCRGEVVDEAALYDSLKKGGILGAGLDVFNSEPLLFDSPLRELDNVVLTPHIGGGTVDAMKRVTRIAASNIKGALFGDGPDPVNIISYIP